MSSQSVTVHAMTIKYSGIVREIATDIRIGNAFISGNTPNHQPFDNSYTAIWDTGATASCITEDVARKLGLETIGETFSQGVTGTAKCNKFLVSLYLPNGIVLPELEVSDCAGDIGCDILIGMDIIKLGDFAVSNYNGKTMFTFRIPSIGEADYTTQQPNQYQAVSLKKAGKNETCPCGSGIKHKKCCGK